MQELKIPICWLKKPFYECLPVLANVAEKSESFIGEHTDTVMNGSMLRSQKQDVMDGGRGYQQMQT